MPLYRILEVSHKHGLGGRGKPHRPQTKEEKLHLLLPDAASVATFKACQEPLLIEHLAEVALAFRACCGISCRRHADVLLQVVGAVTCAGTTTQ